MAIDFPVQSTVAERNTPTVSEDVERVVILDEVECDAVEYLIENVMDIEDEHVDDVKPSIDAEPSNATQEDTIDICETLADMCIGDLISPEIVDGPGFKRLIKELDYKCEVPSSQKANSKKNKILWVSLHAFLRFYRFGTEYIKSLATHLNICLRFLTNVLLTMR